MNNKKISSQYNVNNLEMKNERSITTSGGLTWQYCCFCYFDIDGSGDEDVTKCNGGINLHQNVFYLCSARNSFDGSVYLSTSSSSLTFFVK
jgi:hypothetical protein